MAGVTVIIETEDLEGLKVSKTIHYEVVRTLEELFTKQEAITDEVIEALKRVRTKMVEMVNGSKQSNPQYQR